MSTVKTFQIVTGIRSLTADRSGDYEDLALERG